MKNFKKISFIIIFAVLFLLSLLRACGSKSSAGEVYVYCYGDYFDPEIVADFEAETGIHVVQDTYDTAEEMYPVIEKHSVNYDVVCTSDYMIAKMIDKDLLSPLDKNRIKNIKNIDPKYMEKSLEFDPGNTYSMPHVVGVAGIMYDKKAVGDAEIDSWEDLWDPRFKDKIVMPDSMRDDFMIALKKNGVSMNSTDPADIEKAKEDLMKQKPLVYKYANDSARDLLANGSASVGVVWNGEYVYTKDLNKNVEFVVPKEGSEFFIDAWVIPKAAKNKKNAEMWLDYLARPDVAKKNFDYLYYTTPNRAAYKLIPQKYLSDPAVFPSADVLARCETLKMPDDAGNKRFSDAWKEVKLEK